jgi:hypothetical protein
MTIYLEKKVLLFFENWPQIFFFRQFKINTYDFQFGDFCGLQKRYNKSFSSLSFVAVLGSGMDKNQDPG